MSKTFLDFKKKGERLFLNWHRAHILIRICAPLAQQCANGIALIFSIAALALLHSPMMMLKWQEGGKRKLPANADQGWYHELAPGRGQKFEIHGHICS